MMNRSSERREFQRAPHECEQHLADFAIFKADGVDFSCMTGAVECFECGHRGRLCLITLDAGREACGAPEVDARGIVTNMRIRIQWEPYDQYPPEDDA